MGLIRWGPASLKLSNKQLTIKFNIMLVKCKKTKLQAKNEKNIEIAKINQRLNILFCLFAVVCILGFFSIFNFWPAKLLNALVVGDYNKGAGAGQNNSITAADWNNLKTDFVEKNALIAMGNNKITGLANPTEAQDAVTKSYADKLVKVASGQNVRQNVVIDLENSGFDPNAKDPHIIISEHDFNVDNVDGNTMDASYCGFTKVTKLKFRGTCWVSTDKGGGSVDSTFDWLAIQLP
jgi:hypothetical protein